MKDITKNLLPNEKIVWTYTKKISEQEKIYKRITSFFVFMFIFVVVCINLYQAGYSFIEYFNALIITLALFFISIALNDVLPNSPNQYFLTNFRIISITYETTGRSMPVYVFRAFKYEDITEVKIDEALNNTELLSIILIGKYEVINGYQTFYQMKIPEWQDKLRTYYGHGPNLFLNEEGKKIFLENINKYKPEIKVLNN